ncbi:hypothetical protein NPIL_448411 [Nephila pilipes]|uniref:Uncharacterized protein n=1 Tax=Nephila pilipes TaxID=299642 RepID=A0A8X6MGF5_NEPPI|nr:hypothetical protein NPIL_448411 [Nephila pilipes]
MTSGPPYKIFYVYETSKGGELAIAVRHVPGPADYSDKSSVGNGVGGGLEQEKNDKQFWQIASSNRYEKPITRPGISHLGMTFPLRLDWFHSSCYF